jgi:hypothetical protein
MPDDDDILEISAADLAEEPLPPVPPDDGPVLDLSLDDVSDEALPAAEAFPAVTGDQLLAARNSITIRTLCSSTGRPFAVRYVEHKPGAFVTQQVTPEAEGAEAGTSPYAATGQVEGSFEVTPDYACPFCGSQAVLVCGQCGVDLCAGSGKPHAIVCPGCHSQIKIGGQATSATGLVGKGKGKKL